MDGATPCTTPIGSRSGPQVHHHRHRLVGGAIKLCGAALSWRFGASTADLAPGWIDGAHRRSGAASAVPATRRRSHARAGGLALAEPMFALLDTPPAAVSRGPQLALSSAGAAVDDDDLRSLPRSVGGTVDRCGMRSSPASPRGDRPVGFCRRSGLARVLRGDRRPRRVRRSDASDSGFEPALGRARIVVESARPRSAGHVRG